MGTVLAGNFGSKLADPELDWPTPESVAAAQARDVTYARYDAARWQHIVLAEPFRAVPYGGRSMRDEGSEFTPGVSAGGYDAIYYRWETDCYRLQFRCAQGLLSVMVEPKSVPERPALSAGDARQRAEATVAEIVRRGPQLLAHSTMTLEQKAYGYLILFHQTYEQFKALHRDLTDRERHVERGFISDTADDWLVHLRIRTDGYSFVFDFPKMGVGAQYPTHVSTTQPGEKTWFKERTPP